MEGVDQRDDLIPALAIGIYAVFAGALDRALVGLGARVAEEHGVQPGAAAELFRQLAVGGGVIQVRRVLQRCGLIGHSPDPRGVAVAQRVDADARREVKVALAVGVPGRHALALRQHDLAAAIGVRCMSLSREITFSVFNWVTPFLSYAKAFLRGKAARLGAFPLAGKVAAGRMRSGCPAAARLRDRAKHFALISQRAGPLTASVYALRAAFGGCAPTRACGRSPSGEAIYRFPLR